MTDKGPRRGKPAARSAAAAGLRIPDDIHITGFDKEPWTSLVAGGLPVIEQPVEEIGRRAMRLLLGRIETPNAPTAKVMMKATWIWGAEPSLRRRRHDGSANIRKSVRLRHVREGK